MARKYLGTLQVLRTYTGSKVSPGFIRVKTKQVAADGSATIKDEYWSMIDYVRTVTLRPAPGKSTVSQ